MSQYTEIRIIFVCRVVPVSHKQETTSPEQKSIMGLILSFLGQIMQERALGPTEWDLRPPGIPVSLPLYVWGSWVRATKLLRGSICLNNSKLANFDL